MPLFVEIKSIVQRFSFADGKNVFGLQLALPTGELLEVPVPEKVAERLIILSVTGVAATAPLPQEGYAADVVAPEADPGELRFGEAPVDLPEGVDVAQAAVFGSPPSPASPATPSTKVALPLLHSAPARTVPMDNMGYPIVPQRPAPAVDVGEEDGVPSV